MYIERDFILVPVKSHVKFKDYPSLFKKRIQIFPCLAERFSHGCIDLSSWTLTCN